MQMSGHNRRSFHQEDSYIKFVSEKYFSPLINGVRSSKGAHRQHHTSILANNFQNEWTLHGKLTPTDYRRDIKALKSESRRNAQFSLFSSYELNFLPCQSSSQT